MKDATDRCATCVHALSLYRVLEATAWLAEAFGIARRRASNPMYPEGAHSMSDKTRLAAVLVVSASALAAASAAQSGTTTSACAPKTTAVGGVAKVSFCGPAVATMKAAGMTFRITKGTCATQSGSFFAQVGTIGGPRQGALQSLPLFYVLTDLSAPAKGTILYWIVGGKRYAAAPGLRITKQNRTVRFSGRLIKKPGYTGSGAFSGTLAC